MKRAIAVAMMLVSTRAFANGRMAAALQIVEKPGDENVLLARTTFGLLSSTDRGAHWDWICEGAMGYGGDASIEDPTIALTSNGAMILGVQRGLNVSAVGCAWNFAVAGKPVIDVTVARATPKSAYAITSVAMGDGGTYANEIQRSIDDGQSFAPYASGLDPSVFPITIDIPPSNSQLTYVTAERSRYGSASLFVHDGQSWTEHPIPIAMTEMGAYIAAIDPKNENRIYFRTLDAQSGTSRILVTDDGGKNFTTRFTGQGPLTGFALSEDGSTIWVGGALDFVQRADTTTFQFQKVNGTVQPKCLGSFGNRLYACTNDGDFLDVSEDQGKTFAPLLAYCALRGPIACPADASASVCAANWPGLVMGLGGPCDDGGAPEGGSDAGPSRDASVDGGIVPPKTGGGCGCNETEAPGAPIGMACAIALALRALRARGSRVRRSGVASRRSEDRERRARVDRGRADPSDQP